jgi:predicted Zn-dependent peptidase
MDVEITTLPTGLRVVTEHIPSIRSVAIGCWVDAGTRDERTNEAGAAHFLEHLLFKGSERFSARHISETFDAIGAQSNAFTTKEYTCFWARLLDTDFETGVELLAEMLQRPAFRPHEIDSERQVVIEEINMNDDDPSDVAVEAFVAGLFGGHPLSLPVLGTRESITTMTPTDIGGFWQRRYGNATTVIAVAGNVEHERVLDAVNQHFGAWGTGESGHPLSPPSVRPDVHVVPRSTEQAHIVIGGESISRTAESRFADAVMHHILGGGMSSRLFQTIREERGLAYAVQSFSMPFTETGSWAVYVGTTPAMAGTVLDLLTQELELLVDNGVTDDELDRAKGHMRGAMALSMEDANSRMTRLGRSELLNLPHLSLDERLAKVAAITPEDIQALAEQVLGGPRVIGATGPFESEDLSHYVA